MRMFFEVYIFVSWWVMVVVRHGLSIGLKWPAGCLRRASPWKRLKVIWKFSKLFETAAQRYWLRMILYISTVGFWSNRGVSILLNCSLTSTTNYFISWLPKQLFYYPKLKKNGFPWVTAHFFCENCRGASLNWIAWRTVLGTGDTHGGALFCERHQYVKQDRIVYQRLEGNVCTWKGASFRELFWCVVWDDSFGRMRYCTDCTESLSASWRRASDFGWSREKSGFDNGREMRNPL